MWKKRDTEWIEAVGSCGGIVDKPATHGQPRSSYHLVPDAIHSFLGMDNQSDYPGINMELCNQG
jgi:hypothetical protein